MGSYPGWPYMHAVMMGTGAFAVPTLEALLTRPGLATALITQPDRQAGVQRGSTRQIGLGMKDVAAAAGIPVHQPESINSPEGVALLRALRPDLLVVAAYGQILSREVLGIPALGGINVHASLLPKYRGAAPIAWAIYHGEVRTGVTIIRMSPGLDAGDVLAQEAIDILPEETAGQLESRLAPLGARAALDVIDRMRHGPVAGVPQDPALATRAPKLKKEDGLVDWSRSATQICRQIRAMQPWPTAYTFLHRAGKPPQRVMIQLARPISPLPPSTASAPGAFVPSHQAASIIVASGDPREHVEVLQVQPSGKKSMAASEFLRGHPIQTGDRFGPDMA